MQNSIPRTIESTIGGSHRPLFKCVKFKKNQAGQIFEINNQKRIKMNAYKFDKAPEQNGIPVFQSFDNESNSAKDKKIIRKNLLLKRMLK